MYRRLLYARYCAKRYGVFAKALAEANPSCEGYRKLFADTLYYRTIMINSSINYRLKGD